MSRATEWLEPKAARTPHKAAWWYGEAGKVSVYIETEHGVFSAEIPRAQLAAWLRDTTRKPA